MNVVIWNEGRHERENAAIRDLYPEGIHGALKKGLAAHGIQSSVATLDDPFQGLNSERLEATDVLLWWGHKAHREVEDNLITAIQQRVLNGMGLIVLHSGHHSKICKRLLGTSCNLVWRELEEGERERLWVINPGHPIARGIGPYVEIDASEMYGEPFDIPQPDELVFVSWFAGGEVFRSGCCYKRGLGRIFYFGPGHETFPIYYDRDILKILANAIFWAHKDHRSSDPIQVFNRANPLEPMHKKLSD